MILSHARSSALLAALALAFAGNAYANDATLSASGGDKYLLRYKFAMGEVLRYQVHQATNMRTTIQDTTDAIATRSDSVKAWKVTDVLPSGEMEFIHVVEWVDMTTEKLGAPPMKYDSRTGSQPPRGFEQAASSVGTPLLVVRITGDGEVTFREEKHPQLRPEEDMPITLRLPKERIGAGEKWSYAYEVLADRKSGAKQQVRTRRVCTLRRVDAGVAVIDVEYQILTPVEPYVRSQLKEKITKGTVRFDIERGRILDQEHQADNRVLKFYGEASSVHFASRLQEKLLPEEQDVAQARRVSAAIK